MIATSRQARYASPLVVNPRPQTLKIKSYTSPESVAVACADAIAGVISAHQRPVLILPAGNTPRLLFSELIRRQAEGDLDLRGAEIVQLDELVGVSGQDPRSFQAFLKRNLLVPLGRDGSRDHLIDGTAADPRQEIKRHASRLEGLGQVHLAVLGIGLNGHVAFNEPGTEEGDGARLLPLAATTLQGLKKDFAGDELPTMGMTLGLEELRRAGTIRILATGPKKAAIVAKLLTDPRSSDLPASLLAPHSDLQIFADAAAAPVSIP